LMELMQNSVNSFAALFRGVLRLRYPTTEIPKPPNQVFEKMSELVENYDPSPFIRVLASKEPNKRIRDVDVCLVFNQFVQQIRLTTAYVDQYFGFVKKQEGASS
jgi:hypothetical protein